MVAYICNCQTEGLEAEDQSHPQLHNEFKVSMGYMKACVKKQWVQSQIYGGTHTYNLSIRWRRQTNYEFKISLTTYKDAIKINNNKYKELAQQLSSCFLAHNK